MKILLELAFRIIESPLAPDHRSYRPPSWPPPPDWVVSYDGDGNTVSRWSDTMWDFSHLAGRPLKLKFDSGSSKRLARIGEENKNLLRLIATWMLWGPKGARAWNSLQHSFRLIRRIVVLCEENKISAADLMRFPRVFAEMSKTIPRGNARRNLIRQFDTLLQAREHLGFSIVDEHGIREIARLGLDDVETEQTAYIPPRIWSYQVGRLRECIDDFLAHQEQIKDCFDFCLQAYASSFGSLELAFTGDEEMRKNCLPFSKRAREGYEQKGYVGQFSETAKRFGILPLLQKWLGQKEQLSVSMLSSYFLLVQFAGMAYTINFTLQRVEEGNSLRSDCLQWDEDELLGPIPLICGETTKTEVDSDARWPSSPSVEVAISAMRIVAAMRIKCVVANPALHCDKYDQENPHLVHGSFEPWGTGPKGRTAYSVRPTAVNYQNLIRRYPNLFELDALRITEEDLAFARQFTSNLNEKEFLVGGIWPLAWHQLRRTTAVNMFASGMIDDSSIQTIMKHRSLAQTVYYGRNHTRLRFNDDIDKITTAAKYETMARQISSLLSDRYVSPMGTRRKDEIVVNLMSARDFEKLVKAGQKGEISFRETRLGGCARTGPCEYGGVESVARCAGGDGKRPCGEAIFDKKRKPSVERQLKAVEAKLRIVDAKSPRGMALQMEANGLRNFLHDIE